MAYVKITSDERILCLICGSDDDGVLIDLEVNEYPDDTSCDECEMPIITKEILDRTNTN